MLNTTEVRKATHLLTNVLYTAAQLITEYIGIVFILVFSLS